ncbi:Anion transporter [Balamuthia mandrillaris]
MSSVTSLSAGVGDVDLPTAPQKLPSSQNKAQRFLRFLGRGIRQDLARRLPYYLDDWREGFHLRVPAAVLFMFFTSLAPAVTFGVYLQDNTDQHLGVVEVLLSTAICGILFSLAGGQPLIVVGVTGPVSIFAVTVYQIAEAVDVKFLPFFAWSGIWASLQHLLLAITNAAGLVRFVTRFSAEVFGVLIACIYIANAIEDFWRYFDEEALPAALLSFILAMGTFFVASALDKARRWNILVSPLRAFLADYATAIAILIFTGFSYIGRLEDAKPPRLDIPDEFSTTVEAAVDDAMDALASNGTSSVDLELLEDARGSTEWLIPFWELEGWAIVLALAPGTLLTVLFFFDHNVSSLLSQRAEFNLKKGPAFHWDFFVIGLSIFVCSLLGVPPTNGLIPQAPLHVRSLATIEERTEEVKQTIKVVVKKNKDQKKKKKKMMGKLRRRKQRKGPAAEQQEPTNEQELGVISSDRITSNVTFNDEDPTLASTLPRALPEETEEEIVVLCKREVWTHVYENRLSNFGQSLLIGLMLSPGLIKVLAWIPRGILSGLFLYMGFASFYGNQFAERLMLLITDPRRRPGYPYLFGVPFGVTVLFTGIQLLLWAIIFAVTSSRTPAAVVFPLFILLLVPLRVFLFPRISLMKHYLDKLDEPMVKPEQEAALAAPDEEDQVEELREVGEEMHTFSAEDEDEEDDDKDNEEEEEEERSQTEESEEDEEAGTDDASSTSSNSETTDETNGQR